MMEIVLDGNSHIDPLWLWRWTEGFWTVRYTVRRAVELLKKNPDIVFIFSSAVMYKWIEECEPELFKEVKKLVREGRWVPVGGWWVEPDCNIPCGESFVRQALYGKSYFREKLSVDVKVGYNIDSFGHNASLPQILKKSGYSYYIFMRPGHREKWLPSPLFWWESPDGTRILAYRLPTGYGLSGEGLGRALREIGSNPPLPVTLLLFGKGDHGGGPTEEDLETIRKISKDTGLKIAFAPPTVFFERVLKTCGEIPVVRDELQHHASGCYAVVSEVKALNRRAENLLMAAERFSAFAHIAANLPYPGDRLRRAWELVLLCQFHDALAGTCIPEAYWDVRNMYGEALNIATEALNLAAQRLASQVDTSGGTSLIVFNPGGVAIKFPVEIEPAWPASSSLIDEDGNPVETQEVQASSLAGKRRVVFVTDVPAIGYRTYRITKSRCTAEGNGLLKATETSLENDYFILEIDPDTGSIKRLYDKRLKAEIFRGYGASPVVLKDESDTWSHRILHFKNEEGRFGQAEVRLVEAGPVRATIRVKSRYRDSTIWQDFSLYKGLDFIDVRVRVNWREKHRVLKLAFPVNLDESAATYEIPYGVITRPANGEEEPGQRWVDVSGKLETPEGDVEFGLTLINDSKYSFDVQGSEIRMTILRSPIFAHRDPRKPEPGTDYLYVDQGEQCLRYLLFPHSGGWRTCFQRIAELSEALNTGFFYVFEDPHSGKLPSSGSMVKIHPEGAVLRALKLSEQGSSIVMRLIEYIGRKHKVEVSIPLLDLKNFIEVKPYEIKTLLIPLAEKGKIVECDLMETPLC